MPSTCWDNGATSDGCSKETSNSKILFIYCVLKRLLKLLCLTKGWREAWVESRIFQKLSPRGQKPIIKDPPFNSPATFSAQGRYVYTGKSLWLYLPQKKPYLKTHQLCFQLGDTLIRTPLPCRILQAEHTFVLEVHTLLKSFLRLMICYVFASGVDFGRWPFILQHRGVTILYSRYSGEWLGLIAKWCQPWCGNNTIRPPLLLCQIWEFSHKKKGGK